jgi:coatomer subunit beta'
VVTIATEASFFILRYNKDIVARMIDSGIEAGDEGIEDAFELLSETNERVRTAQWAGDCFVYTNAANRLNYCVGGEIFTISHLDRQMYLLGYVPQHNRLYLADKVMSHTHTHDTHDTHNNAPPCLLTLPSPPSICRT